MRGRPCREKKLPKGRKPARNNFFTAVCRDLPNLGQELASGCKTLGILVSYKTASYCRIKSVRDATATRHESRAVLLFLLAYEGGTTTCVHPSGTDPELGARNAYLASWVARARSAICA